MKILDGELEHLYLKFCSGDEQAQLQLYTATKNRLINYLKRLSLSCSGMVDAEDCMQITWESLWKKCSSYQNKGKFIHYLFTVAKSRYIDEYRKVYGVERRPEIMDINGEHCEPFVSFSESEEFFGKTHINVEQFDDPAFMHLKQEYSTLLKNVIKDLPHLQQQAIILYLSDYSAKEISQLTGENHEAIRMQIRYAKQKLLQFFASENLSFDRTGDS